MLTYVDSTTPNEAGLWQWLKRYTGAESETTIEKYVGFQRSIELLTLQDGQYQTTPRGTEYAETGEQRVLLDALLEHVKGFEAILRAVENGTTRQRRSRHGYERNTPNINSLRPLLVDILNGFRRLMLSNLLATDLR